MSSLRKQVAVIKVRKMDDGASEKFSIARENIQRIVELALKEIASDPDCVGLRYSVGEQTTVYYIKTNQDNFGRVLGSGGRTINCLRHLVTAIAGRHGFRAILQVENEDQFY